MEGDKVAKILEKIVTLYGISRFLNMLLAATKLRQALADPEKSKQLEQ
jgi:hypothetical protein